MQMRPFSGNNTATCSCSIIEYAARSLAGAESIKHFAHSLVFYCCADICPRAPSSARHLRADDHLFLMWLSQVWHVYGLSLPLLQHDRAVRWLLLTSPNSPIMFFLCFYALLTGNTDFLEFWCNNNLLLALYFQQGRAHAGRMIGKPLHNIIAIFN